VTTDHELIIELLDAVDVILARPDAKLMDRGRLERLLS